MLLDLGNVLVNLYKFWKQDREIQAWAILILSTGYSGFLGLFGAWGTALLAGSSPWVAFGCGLMGCAVSVLTVLLRIPQGRSLMLSVPQSVVKDYQTSSETVIQSKKEK